MEYTRLAKAMEGTVPFAWIRSSLCDFTFLQQIMQTTRVCQNRKSQPDKKSNYHGPNQRRFSGPSTNSEKVIADSQQSEFHDVDNGLDDDGEDEGLHYPLKCFPLGVCG